MKLGIFGDSYADAKIDNESSWIHILCNLLKQDDQYKNLTVDCHGKGGSSLYFSYKNFLNIRYKYDTVIFIVTEPHRYPVPFIPEGTNNTHYISNHTHAEQIKQSYKDTVSEKEIKFLENIQGWFSASHEKYNEDIHELILSDLESKHHNIILYPCFINSFKPERFKKFGLDPILHPLHSLWYRQCELFGIDSSNFTAHEKPTLQCHLTPEFNEFIANNFLSKLKTGKWNHSGFFDIKVKLPKTHYYSNWD
jgi:hypothetical protein